MPKMSGTAAIFVIVLLCAVKVQGFKKGGGDGAAGERMNLASWPDITLSA